MKQQNDSQSLEKITKRHLRYWKQDTAISRFALVRIWKT